MDAKTFAQLWKDEKEKLLSDYASSSKDLEVNRLIKSMALNFEQSEIMQGVINGILTDVFYTLLLGLDGSARIGEAQQMYTILDEDGNTVSSGNGELEEAAYELFQEEH